MHVSPSVRAVQVPDTSPMHPQFTTIYLVGRGQVLTVDSGEDAERYRWMLRGYLAATEKAEIGQSVVTHSHPDHSANLRWLHDEFDAQLHVPRATAPLLRDRLPADGVKLLDDGDEVSPGGGLRLRVIHTPGHSLDSVCFYLEDEGVLFTGDTVLGASTTTVNDVADYQATLQRLRALPNLRVICPGHGPIIDDPIDWLDYCLRHRQEREDLIVAALIEGGALTSWQITEKLYVDLDPRLLRLADANVRAHLRKLEKEGRLKVQPGTPRPRPAASLAQMQAEERERQEVIRKAEEYREQARRRALFFMEGLPPEDWEEPPRFELS